LSNAIQYRMNAGIPGTDSRPQISTVVAEQLDPTNYPTGYGVPVAVDGTTHLIRKIMTGDVAANIYGMYVRPYPTQTTGTDPLGTSTAPPTGHANIMKRGFMMVLLGGATAAVKNGTVYVRVAAAATGKPIGGIEAAADSTNTIVMANAYFTGPADANGNVELAFNI
jgi:hypothetical protein